MQSAIEKFASRKLHRLREAIMHRDRGVVAGAMLSFIPIFPACTIGFAISTVNFFLILNKKLDQNELKIVIYSVVIGLLFSMFWFYILMHFGVQLIAAVYYILDAVSSALTTLNITPWEYDGADEFNV